MTTQTAPPKTVEQLLQEQNKLIETLINAVCVGVGLLFGIVLLMLIFLPLIAHELGQITPP